MCGGLCFLIPSPSPPSPLCADELASDRLIPQLSLHAVNTNMVKFRGWSMTSTMPVRNVS